MWLSGQLPYEQCRATFERIGHRIIPTTSIWRQSQAYGERMQAVACEEQQRLSVERTTLPDEDEPTRKSVGMDGGMVHIRQEGWKEIKVGSVCDIAQRAVYDPSIQEITDVTYGINTAYTAVLGAVEQFKPAMWALAVAQGVPIAADTCVSADGAAWIWNLAADRFPMSIEIVDWYHAVRRLNDASQALYPDAPDRATRWFKNRKHDLFQGHVWKIIEPLQAAGLSEHYTYFLTHQRRMHYHEFRENAYLIGSGTTESGVKQFKARLTASGMRWSRPGAQRMIAIRSAVLGQSFDTIWQSVA